MQYASKALPLQSNFICSSANLAAGPLQHGEWHVDETFGQGHSLGRCSEQQQRGWRFSYHGFGFSIYTPLAVATWSFQPLRFGTATLGRAHACPAAFSQSSANMFSVRILARNPSSGPRIRTWTAGGSDGRPWSNSAGVVASTRTATAKKSPNILRCLVPLLL